MALNDEMYKQYLRQKQLEEYNKKKKELNSQRQINGLSKIKSFYDNINSNGNKLNNFGQTMSQSQNGAVANLGNKLQSFGNRLQSFGQPSTTAVSNPITSSIGSEIGSNALSNSLLKCFLLIFLNCSAINSNVSFILIYLFKFHDAKLCQICETAKFFRLNIVNGRKLNRN